MTATDGKKRLTDVADTERLLRIIQAIPSPKDEPFKLWLAQVGRERIEETIDPELTIDRALETYLKKGYSHEWVNQRLQAIQVRKEKALPNGRALICIRRYFSCIARDTKHLQMISHLPLVYAAPSIM